MQAGAGYVAQDVGKDRQIPCHRHLLGRRRPAAEAQHGRHEPVVRFRIDGQRRLLGVVDDREPEGARIGERGPQDGRRPNRRPVIGEADDARVGELTEGGQLVPCPTGRDRAVGQQLDRRPTGRRGGMDLGEHAGLVQGGCRVRHGADRA